jgi:DNA-binding NtrC family response regulator
MLPGAPPFQEAEIVAKARAVASRLAESDLPIVVIGEVGTGRRTLAAALAQKRSHGTLPILVASAFDGVPGELRERGTGASVLVLHHVHALDPRSQSELVALVRDHRALLVATGEREGVGLTPDLSALLDATRVMLPSLRERGDDAVKWAEVFAARAATDLGRPLPKLSVDARRAVSAHCWPGNLAELESVLRRAVLLGSSAAIEPADLGFTEKLIVQPLTDALEEYRMSYVRRVLAHFDGNRTQAARALGIDPRTMFRYLAKAKDGGA